MPRLLFLRAFALAVFCCAAPIRAAAAEMPYFANVVILAAPDAGAERRVHDAIVEAANNQGWKIAQDTHRLLRLELIVRNQYAVIVNIHIKIDMVDVEYVSSINMGYKKDAEGRKAISPAYGKWVIRLLNAARQYAALMWPAPAPERIQPAQPVAQTPPEPPEQPPVQPAQPDPPVAASPWCAFAAAHPSCRNE
ncbi:MAG: hypothetical protein LBJ59_04385 [Zoogloeaceae bacterium]|nr:hypothetical protein [Zoogloeaceae bacterium]